MISNHNSVLAAIRDVAERHPNQVALSFGKETMTYRTLWSTTLNVASALRRHGVNETSFVGISEKRSEWLIPILLGIMATGAAFVPLDPSYPEARLSQMITAANITLLITDGSMSVPFSYTLHHSQLISESQKLNEHSWAPKNVAHAYVLFTSGSTGVPKGVVGSLSGIANRVKWVQSTYPVALDERFVLKTTLNFVDAMWDIFVPLCSGARLDILAEGALNDPESFSTELARLRTSRVSLVPSYIHTLLDIVPDVSHKLPHLSFLDITGEQFHASQGRRLAATFPRSTILNRYGTTEAPSTLDFLFSDYDRERHGPTVPIGRAISGTRGYVLNEDCSVAPAGEEGELCLSGPNLALRYLHSDEQTGSRFILGPLGSPKTERLYRTGDRVRLLPDGNFLCLGRNDTQVQLNAHRVELGEIEAVAAESAMVLESVASLQSHNENKWITLHVSSGSRVYDESSLRTLLSSKLPSYMVPNDIRIWENLPRLPNGKIDRLKLRDSANRPVSVVSSRVAPATRHLDFLAMVGSILGTVINDMSLNFIAIGGHSLSGMRLAARIKQDTGRPFSMQNILNSETLLEIYQEAYDETPSETVRLPLVKLGARQSAHGTLQQYLFWKLDSELGPWRHVYNDTWMLKLSGPIDPNKLELALHKLLHTQFSLVLQFERNLHGFTQSKSDTAFQGLERVSLIHETPVMQEQSLQALVMSLHKRAFNLQREVPLSAHLVQLSDVEAILVISTHHITEDAFSGHILNREFAAAYEGRILVEPDVTIFDYGDWQQAKHLAGHYNEGVEYWANTLSGYDSEMSELRTAQHRATPAFEGNIVRSILSSSWVEEMQTRARADRATPFVILLAAFFLAVYRISGRADLAIGSPSSQRDIPEINDLVGFFANMLVFRLELRQDMSVHEVVACTRSVVMEAYKYQDVPFALVVDKLKAWRGGRHPIVDIAFGIRGIDRLFGEGLTLGEATVNRLRLPVSCRESKFDLDLTVDFQASGEMELELLYNSNVISHERAHLVLDAILVVLEQMTA